MQQLDVLGKNTDLCKESNKISKTYKPCEA